MIEKVALAEKAAEKAGKFFVKYNFKTRLSEASSIANNRANRIGLF